MTFYSDLARRVCFPGCGGIKGGGDKKIPSSDEDGMGTALLSEDQRVMVRLPAPISITMVNCGPEPSWV